VLETQSQEEAGVEDVEGEDVGDNGVKKINLVNAYLEDGKINVSCNRDVNITLVSHAIRLLSLDLDNELMARVMKKEQGSIKPVSQLPDILKRMRK